MHQSAIDFNNKACSLIDTDCFEEALGSLGQALSCVRNGLDEIMEGGPENNNPSNKPKEIKSLSTSSRRRKELEGLKSYVFYHVLYIHKIPRDYGHRLLTSVIIFNFALCHHLMALRDQDKKSKKEKLVGALKLYQYAVTLYMEGNGHIEATSATHLLATINNSAHIYELLNRPKKAEAFRDQMLSSLMVMIENGQAHTLEEYEGFLHCASNTILQETVTAAAA